MKLNTTILAVIAASIGAASAASISVNFSENSGNQNWTSVENIGPLSVSTANFNSSNDPTGGPANTHTIGGNIGTGTIGDLVDSTGAAVAGSTVTYGSKEVWFSGAGTATNEGRLSVGYLDDGINPAGGFVNISVSNVPYAQYSVYIILASDQGGGSAYTSRDFDVNGGGTGANVLAYNYFGADVANTAWTQATDTVRGNYVLKTGQTATTLSIVGPERDGDNRGSLAGIIIEDTTPIPEPSSSALLGLGGLALILRRRK